MTDERLAEIEAIARATQQGKLAPFHFEDICTPTTALELISTVRKYKAALETLANQDKFELLCGATDWDCVEDAYSAGSINAWCQTSEIAREALDEDKRDT